MRDELDDRIWETGHDRFAASVTRGLDRLSNGFKRLRQAGQAASGRGGAVARISGRHGLGMLAGLAVLIGFAAGAEPAAAAPPEGRVAISHADLNLTAAAGVAKLDARIRQAARRLCTENDILTARSTADTKQCVAAAIASARPQIDAAVARQRAGLLASRAAPINPE
jgi:UrcA family protein